MSTTTLDLTGLDRRLQQVRDILHLDASPLMLRWMMVVLDDNRRGILQGLDGFGVPMVPTKYRPVNTIASLKSTLAFKKAVGSAPKSIAQTRAELRKHQEIVKVLRQGQKANVKVGKFAGGAGNNLTTTEYRLLGGPPLAPREQFSRSITNFKTTFTDPRQGGAEWAVIGAWDDVVSKTGYHFLPAHFNGLGRLPRRDLRGVRPTGMAKCMDALRNWARLAIREHFTP